MWCLPMQPTTLRWFWLNTGATVSLVPGRPAHSAWCRVLLLMSTLLASGAAAEEAEVFIQARSGRCQVYRNRFCYVFQSALQSGRLAAARLHS